MPGKVFQLSLTRDELLILRSSLNEVCNGIDLFEFETRMGASREEVAALMVKLKTITPAK